MVQLLIHAPCPLSSASLPLYQTALRHKKNFSETKKQNMPIWYDQRKNEAMCLTYRFYKGDMNCSRTWPQRWNPSTLEIVKWGDPTFSCS